MQIIFIILLLVTIFLLIDYITRNYKYLNQIFNYFLVLNMLFSNPIIFFLSLIVVVKTFNIDIALINNYLYYMFFVSILLSLSVFMVYLLLKKVLDKQIKEYELYKYSKYFLPFIPFSITYLLLFSKEGFEFQLVYLVQLIIPFLLVYIVFFYICKQLIIKFMKGDENVR